MRLAPPLSSAQQRDGAKNRNRLRASPHQLADWPSKPQGFVDCGATSSVVTFGGAVSSAYSFGLGEAAPDGALVLLVSFHASLSEVPRFPVSPECL